MNPGHVSPGEAPEVENIEVKSILFRNLILILTYPKPKTWSKLDCYCSSTSNLILTSSKPKAKPYPNLDSNPNLP